MNRRQFLQTSLGTLTLGVRPPQSNAKIGLGVIGLGRQGMALLHTIRQMRSAVELVALCDVNPETSSAATKLLPTAHSTPHYADLLQRADVQAVMIATPDEQHVEIASAALKAGLDVYLEAPIARSLADVQSLIQLAQSRQAVVQIGIEAVSHPMLSLIRNLIIEGYLGSVSQIEVAVPCPDAIPVWQQSNSQSDGLAAWHLVETMEQVRQLMGVSMPRKIAAQGIGSDANTNPDNFHALLHYQEGFIVHFAMGHIPRRFSIYGTSGSVDLLSGKLVGADGTISIEFAAISEELQTTLTENALYYHVEDWIAAVRERRQPRLPIQLGIDHVTLVRAAQSAETIRTKKGH